MLNVHLDPGDVVLVVMPVDVAEIVVVGSTRVRCAECERLCWRAPGPPQVQMTTFGEIRRAPLGGREPSVLLCPTCTALHSGLLI